MTPAVVGEPDPATLAAVAEIVGRCVPWVRLHVGATITCGSWGRWDPDGTPDGAGVVMIATDPGILCAMETAHHEVWHAVEGWLAPDAVASVSALVDDGLSFADTYLDSLAERRARLYASLARAWDEGLGMSVRPNDRAVIIMYQIYCGDVAAHIIITGDVRPRSKSLVGRAATALGLR